MRRSAGLGEHPDGPGVRVATLRDYLAGAHSRDRPDAGRGRAAQPRPCQHPPRGALGRWQFPRTPWPGRSGSSPATRSPSPRLAGGLAAGLPHLAWGSVVDSSCHDSVTGCGVIETALQVAAGSLRASMRRRRCGTARSPGWRGTSPRNRCSWSTPTRRAGRPARPHTCQRPPRGPRWPWPRRTGGCSGPRSWGGPRRSWPGSRSPPRGWPSWAVSRPGAVRPAGPPASTSTRRVASWSSTSLRSLGPSGLTQSARRSGWPRLWPGTGRGAVDPRDRRRAPQATRRRGGLRRARLVGLDPAAC